MNAATERVKAVFRALAEVSARRPRTVLMAACALAVVALALAAGRLELRTSNLDLIDPDLPEVRHFREVAESFGTPNVLLVVLESDDPAALRAMVDTLGPRLRALPGVRAVADRLPIDDGVAEVTGIDPYLVSRDGGLAVLFVQPADPSSSAETLAPFVEGARRELEALGLRRADAPVRGGLTGMPAYALDDRDIIQRDISKLSLLGLAAILALFITAFGAARRPLLAVVALLFAVLWTVGAAALVPGHLTLLSAFFASILFGLGIDAGIHLIDRMEEELARGVGEADAVARAAGELGPALLAGTLTTASVLYALQWSGFLGFAELGLIAGTGMLLSLAATVTVLPALLVLWPSRGSGRRLRERRLGQWLGRVQSRPAAVLVGVLAVAALAWWAVGGGPGFDTDYLNLQPKNSEAVRLERELVKRSEYSPVFAVFTAEDREQLGELIWRLADDESVAAVRSIRDLEVYGALPDLAPEELAAFRAPDGRLAVYAYPAEDIWRPAAGEDFLRRMREIDPEVTGMPVLGAFMVERSRRAMRVAAWLGGALLVFWIALSFRRPLPALLALLPTVLTAASLGALMRLAGISFNPLSVMALPVVLGIAVDDGVHLVHRFLAEQGDLRRTLAGAGRAVTLTSATTLAAFGALVFTEHRGLASFAGAISLGVAASWAATLIVLPPLLNALSGRLLSGRLLSGRLLSRR